MKGIMVFFIFILLLSCKVDNNKNNKTNENITGIDQITNNRIELQEGQKIMFVSGLETIDIWDKPWYLDFPKAFLGNIPFGKEVIVLDQENHDDISWSKINYNDKIGYISSSFLSESKEKCELFDLSGINKYLGIYTYNHSKKYIGNIDNISNIKLGQLKGNFSSELDWENWEWGNSVKDNFIEVKLFDKEHLLFLDYYSDLDLYNEYIFTIPGDYFEIQQIDHSMSMKPHYYEYYFIENGIVYRTGDYNMDDSNDAVYSSVAEMYYKK